MFLAQLRHVPGMHLVGIADMSPAAACGNLHRVGWPVPAYAARSLDEAARLGNTHVGDDWKALVAHPAIDIVVESTGNPLAAVEHILDAFEHGKHVVNVTVEADALCGLALARRARSAGIIYSLAYGDQPALICELVDWARAAGFEVIAAGRGHKWLPIFADSTPDTVWSHYGLTPEQAQVGGLNPRMFNSFLDGSKPAIECAAVCNATGTDRATGRPALSAASIDEIAESAGPPPTGVC